MSNLIIRSNITNSGNQGQQYGKHDLLNMFFTSSFLKSSCRFVQPTGACARGDDVEKYDEIWIQMCAKDEPIGLILATGGLVTQNMCQALFQNNQAKRLNKIKT